MRRNVLLAALCLLLAGCATTPAQRIARDPTAFAAWPAAVQAKIRAGEVAIGFTPAQARMALGEPDRKFTRAVHGGTEETWIYGRRGPRFSFGLGMSTGDRHSGMGMATAVRSDGPRHGARLRLVFRDGRVSVIERAIR